MNNTRALGISSIIGLTFLASAILILTLGHLHEDAYILFQYSKKLSLGQGIVFDEVSGPTEGATDFLWMVSLAFLHYLGIDLGSSAALLNSVGIVLISYVILKLCNKFDWRAFSSLFLVVFCGGRKRASCCSFKVLHHLAPPFSPKTTSFSQSEILKRRRSERATNNSTAITTTTTTTRSSRGHQSLPF